MVGFQVNFFLEVIQVFFAGGGEDIHLKISILS